MNTETLHRLPIFIDCRHLRKNKPTDPHDIAVEDQTAALLDQHVGEGIYSHGIKFFGITYRNVRRANCGPNCVDNKYINVFIPRRDGYLHVYIIPPKR